MGAFLSDRRGSKDAHLTSDTNRVNPVLRTYDVRRARPGIAGGSRAARKRPRRANLHVMTWEIGRGRKTRANYANSADLVGHADCADSLHDPTIGEGLPRPSGLLGFLKWHGQCSIQVRCSLTSSSLSSEGQLLRQTTARGAGLLVASRKPRYSLFAVCLVREKLPEKSWPFFLAPMLVELASLTLVSGH